MKSIIHEPRFDFLSDRDKEFIISFDEEMNQLGFGFGGAITSGYCWGKYMIIYTRTGLKSKKVYARIYMREDCIVLRMFFSDIDRQREYIEQAPTHIKQVFTGSHGDCQHCHNEKDGGCRFRKTYIIDGRRIDKCNGIVFEFHDPGVEKLPDYLGLFTRFYPTKELFLK
jgi:hypothetical protein